jgi:hypothetical protein
VTREARRAAVLAAAAAAASAAVLGGVAHAKGEPHNQVGEPGKPSGATAVCTRMAKPDYRMAHCWSRPGEPGTPGQAADY